MRLFVFTAAVAAAAVTAPAHANLYRYTGQITASGTVGSQSFTDAPITITLTGDTSNYEFNNGTLFRLRDVTGGATVEIGGLGTVTVTSPDFVIYSQTFFRTVGFARIGVNPLVRTVSGSLQHDLNSNFGPASFTPDIIPNTANVGTTLGTLNFSSASSNFVYTAALVPAPGAAALLAAAGVLTFRRRR